MTSPFALLFLAIQQRLNAITDEDDNPIFKFNDQDLGQLEDNSKGMNRPPVAWPCVLTDIDDSNFENMGENAQSGVLNISIRIGFPPFSSTEMRTPPAYKNKALYFYDLEDAVFKTLHGWSPGSVVVSPAEPPEEEVTADLSDIFGYFIRVRTTKEDRNDLLRVRVLTFTLSMDDYSTANEITMVPASISLSTAINIP